jgi:hypothetical protein
MIDIREKHMVLSCLQVSISKPSELNRALYGLGADELNGEVIRAGSSGRKHWPPLEHKVLAASPGAGNKTALVGGESDKPGEIHDGPVHHHIAEGGRCQEASGYSELVAIAAVTLTEGEM